MTAQLPARVVQRLVQRIAVRVQAVREHVDRYAVQRERRQHATLVRREDLLDGALERVEHVPLLGLGLRAEVAAREDRPRLRLERQLTSLPRALAQLHRRLEERELVRPRREPALAAEVAETTEHA